MNRFFLLPIVLLLLLAATGCANHRAQVDAINKRSEVQVAAQSAFLAKLGDIADRLAAAPARPIVEIPQGEGKAAIKVYNQISDMALMKDLIHEYAQIKQEALVYPEDPVVAGLREVRQTIAKPAEVLMWGLAGRWWLDSLGGLAGDRTSITAGGDYAGGDMSKPYTYSQETVTETITETVTETAIDESTQITD